MICNRCNRELKQSDTTAERPISIELRAIDVKGRVNSLDLESF